jgi:hypothetical protein
MATNVRKGQLISTFGPGAMMVDARGVSVMTCGLDHWYKDVDGNALTSVELYKVNDKRLAKRLDVDHFRLPPDAETPINENDKDKVKTPLYGVRFPSWHICSKGSCQRLVKCGPGAVHTQRCPECSSQLYQSRFVTVCKSGHIDDFPWHQWVHRSLSPDCNGSRLKLQSIGSSALSGIFVKCDECNKRRSLSGITVLDGEESFLSKNLEGPEKSPYLCRGHSPWLGDHDEVCSEQTVGILRQATNVYFSRLVGSIHLPVEASNGLQELIDLLGSDELQIYRSIIKEMPDDTKLDVIKPVAPGASYHSDKMILEALTQLSDADGQASLLENNQTEGEQEALYRYQERGLITKGMQSENLKSTPIDLKKYDDWFSRYFSNVSLVDRLTETRALVGFDRYKPNSSKTFKQYQEQLFKNLPVEANERWLPAIQVFGEGIYLEFNEILLQDWEKKSAVSSRSVKLSQRLMNDDYQSRDHISARFLLIHTFAHIFMNRLVYDCGYSSASLRERLYVSDDKETNMAGVLIYTASGDSEGSLGGLVRMGQPGELERIILETLREAQWCSSDPVCTETGNTSGQGPGSLNLAACHSCALIPETSCEEFNLLLDRSCVISHNESGSGFFDRIE